MKIDMYKTRINPTCKLSIPLEDAAALMMRGVGGV